MQNKLLIKNFEFISQLNKKILATNDFDEKIKLISFATFWMVRNNSGLYFNIELEKELCRMSKKIPTIESSKKIDKSLLIMTQAYKTGGHTRIVEALINSSKNDKFDLFFTNNSFEIPNSIVNICKQKNCNIIISEKSDTLEKAKSLRTIASVYKNIVLHIHPDDFIPLLAFGIKEWDIPIFLYNHSDHMAWLGTSIADCVMDMSTASSEFSLSYRHVQKSEVLPIPVTSEVKNSDDNKTLRKKLGLPSDATVLFSAGSEYKYRPTPDLDFRNIVSQILNGIENVYMVIAGISSEDPLWSHMVKKYRGKLILIEKLPYEEYKKLYSVADIYIDSMPMSGFTVVLEASVRKIPIVFLKSEFFFPDSIIDQAISPEEILSTIHKIINNDCLPNMDVTEHLIENFVKKHDEILLTVKKHRCFFDKKQKNLNSNLDFDENGYSSEMLSKVFKNKNIYNYELFRQLSLKNKFFVIYLIIFVLHDYSTVFKNILKISSKKV